ncbi:hypothetical protein FDJ19_gp155 [Vibrio phage Ceto]|uniref:Uncharacterized protein n=1 Tax=Vibrio phage Ceto TaxID=2570300 RepID=A0A2H5BGN0_9CAUD|nr:hypothetical protein FDJ19_gp155 [Vibrio phage Ceto]AUG85143.1 hypothetical protein CETO_161 [Vibrio phage Ceto]
MSWIGITAIVGVLVVFASLIAAYCRGYKEGYRDGEVSGHILSSLDSLDPEGEMK